MTNVVARPRPGEGPHTSWRVKVRCRQCVAKDRRSEDLSASSSLALSKGFQAPPSRSHRRQSPLLFVARNMGVFVFFALCLLGLALASANPQPPPAFTPVQTSFLSVVPLDEFNDCSFRVFVFLRSHYSLSPDPFAVVEVNRVSKIVRLSLPSSARSTAFFVLINFNCIILNRTRRQSGWMRLVTRADAEVGIIPDPLADDPTVEIGILLIFVNY